VVKGTGKRGCKRSSVSKNFLGKQNRGKSVRRDKQRVVEEKRKSQGHRSPQKLGNHPHILAPLQRANFNNAGWVYYLEGETQEGGGSTEVGEGGKNQLKKKGWTKNRKQRYKTP